MDANGKEYIIGVPKKENSIKVKILDKKLHLKLLFHPDLYFGEAYTDGNVKIENGSTYPSASVIAVDGNNAIIVVNAAGVAI